MNTSIPYFLSFFVIFVTSHIYFPILCSLNSEKKKIRKKNKKTNFVKNELKKRNIKI